MASARIVPGLPSGNATTRNTTPSTRRKCWAANSDPNNGCVAAVTLTSHGNTARRCCSLSESLPGPGKTHLAIGLGIKAAQAGHRVLFATATEWVTRLQAAHHAGRLADELTRLSRYGLLIVDLCRSRNYADYCGAAGGSVAWAGIPGRTAAERSA